MRARDYIITKQISWARNNSIKITGSQGERGHQGYTTNLEDNLFIPLTKDTRSDFAQGSGGELSGNPSKMQALHSSSAIGVNFFQYWQSMQQVPSIARACKLCGKNNQSPQIIKFEEKFTIHPEYTIPPNLDVVIHNDPASTFKVYAIECKFSEAYSSIKRDRGLKPKYFLYPEIWEGIPNLHKLAIEISPVDQINKHLDAPQLIKHTLGLKKKYGKKGFRLLYLWYDALGEEGYLHRCEVKAFKQVCAQDDISFLAITYQEVIRNLLNMFPNEHKEYLSYLSSRYL